MHMLCWYLSNTPETFAVETSPDVGYLRVKFNSDMRHVVCSAFYESDKLTEKFDHFSITIFLLNIFLIENRIVYVV